VLADATGQKSEMSPDVPDPLLIIFSAVSPERARQENGWGGKIYKDFPVHFGPVLANLIETGARRSRVPLYSVIIRLLWPNQRGFRVDPAPV
jgi:hypothetical protein